jgi:predicted NodU family carbamoyl transferase
MIILGLNAFHAEFFSRIRDGKLIAAAEEERFRRIKQLSRISFAGDHFTYCSEAGIKLSDIDHIAFNQDSRVNLLRKITYFMTKRPNINLVLSGGCVIDARGPAFPHFLSKRFLAKLFARRSIQLNIISRTAPILSERT